MTSGTPESTQNWVLAGFQNSLDLASMSPLEAKAMSSSATVTSAPRHSNSAPAASGTLRLRREAPFAPLGTLHICAATPGIFAPCPFGSTKQIPDVTD